MRSKLKSEIRNDIRGRDFSLDLIVGTILIAGRGRVQFAADSFQVSRHGLLRLLHIFKSQVLHVAFGHAAQDFIEAAKVHTKKCSGTEMRRNECHMD